MPIHFYLIKTSGQMSIVERTYNSTMEAFKAMRAKMDEEDKLNRGTSWWVISTPRELGPGMVLNGDY